MQKLIPGLLDNTIEFFNFEDDVKFISDGKLKSFTEAPASVVLMLKEAIDLMLRQIERNFKFYAKVARIEGQNSFEKIALDGFSKLFLEIFILKDTFAANDFKPMTPEILAKYYANGLTFIIISWLSGEPTVTAALIGEIYQRISSISINGLVKTNGGYTKP